MKINSIVKVEKKKTSPYNDNDRFVTGYNQGQEDYGNKDIGLDVGKIEKVIFDYLLRTQKERMLQVTARRFGKNTKVSESLAQALKAKQGEIIVEVKG